MNQKEDISWQRQKFIEKGKVLLSLRWNSLGKVLRFKAYFILGNWSCFRDSLILSCLQEISLVWDTLATSGKVLSLHSRLPCSAVGQFCCCCVLPPGKQILIASLPVGGSSWKYILHMYKIHLY